MKTIINVLLILGIIGLAYLLVQSIREPIAFKDVKEEREEAVINKLKSIRSAQELYRDVTGEFAPSFDTLIQVIKTGQITSIKVEGDPDDPTGQEFTIDTLYYSALDSAKSMELDLENLPLVPYSENKRFMINADTITYQKTTVPVVEVGIARKEFMGKYGSPLYAKYDNSYDPSAVIKFGSMDAPNLAGNWE